MNDNVINQIKNGETCLGIEMGSTRIKAVLIDKDNNPIASGGFAWENTLTDGVWTYALDEVWVGIQSSYKALKRDVQKKFKITLKNINAIGFSGMMHGYLVFDKEGSLLTPFRTWRNNLTEKASKELTGLFQYNIPQRWSIAHLYQAIVNEEPHVDKIDFLTTLAGYVHWKLTGAKVLGIGEASGMFPIDLNDKGFNKKHMDSFDKLIGSKNYDWKLGDILPKTLTAGKQAGELTTEGVLLLDPDGDLSAGIPLCPPEGDAGTGMVATNSVAKRTGNVSAGTSVFAMLVLEKELSKVHPEIDLVTTPDGNLVAMAHSNNCTSDFNAWVSLFGQAAKALGQDISMDTLYETFMNLALKGDSHCGGLLSYGYVSGEHMTGFSEGRPLFVRSSHSDFTLENFMRTHLQSALCALRTGLNILFEEENVQVDEIRGHGGLFKTPLAGQKIMAAATNTPISVMSTAGEGGAWGIALLASYMRQEDSSATLPEFLTEIFKESMGDLVAPDPRDVDGFNEFFERYHKGLAIERAAVESLD